MCFATAYSSTANSQPILKDIAQVRVRGNTVELETLFGENKVLQGKLQEIDFVNSKIVIKQ
jgi:predicted RNA-binding protein